MRFQICPAFHIATLQSHWLYFHLPTPNKANPVSYISQTSALDQSEISKFLLYNISQTHFCIVKMVRLIKFYHSEQQSLSSQLKKIQIASRPVQSKYRKGPIYQNFLISWVIFVQIHFELSTPNKSASLRCFGVFICHTDQFLSLLKSLIFWVFILGF